MQRIPWLPLAGLTLAGIVLAQACAGTTEITVHVTTDASCTSLPGSVHFRALGLATGVPSKLDISSPNGTTTSCTPLTEFLGVGYGPNDLGTLGLVPGGAKDGPVEIVVVAAIDSDNIQGVSLDACLAWAATQTAAKGYRNASDPDTSKPLMPCLVARRLLSFTPHASVELPIQLDAQCAGVTCPAGYTCEYQTCVLEQTVCQPGQPCTIGMTGGAGGTGPTSVSVSNVSSTQGSTNVASSSTNKGSSAAGSGSSSTGGACCTGKMCAVGSSCSPVTCQCECACPLTCPVGDIGQCVGPSCTCQCDLTLCKIFCTPKLKKGVCTMMGFSSQCECI